jgi:hypothetical protein
MRLRRVIAADDRSTQNAAFERESNHSSRVDFGPGAV